jgi:ssDNA-binding Zn-finger/Zn-ribbon topoisomerase 1
VISVLGGQALIRRRTCDKCGRPRIFARHLVSGRPFLGCSDFPVCKNSRFLGNYTL